MSHIYTDTFYDYIGDGSRRSACAIAALLRNEMTVASLLDLGGGHGAWASAWIDAGVDDVVAVDGAYVDLNHLMIDASKFRSHDLETPLDLGRKFDLVQSLEVAEHLPEEKAGQFVESLVRHGDVVLFSAAVPHQGGEHHVNEREPQYWRGLFAAHDYKAYDWLRPRIARDKSIMPWYRFNSIIYANAEGARRLSADVLAAEVPSGENLPLGGDFGWAMRRAAVRMIPAPLVKHIAIAKAQMETRFRRAER